MRCVWLFLAMSRAVQAAEVTEMPPAMRGDTTLAYDGTWGFGHLEEGGEARAQQHSARQSLGIDAEFAPVEGFAVHLAAPFSLSRQTRWSDAYGMVYEPTTNSGTTLGGPALEGDTTVKSSGFDGLWFGVAAGSALLGHPRTDWRVDAALRLPGGHSYWDDEHRGSSSGGLASHFSAAFTAHRGPASPYLKLGATLEGKTKADVLDASGTAVVVRVDPASAVDALGGVELDALPSGTAERFAWDLFGGFGYRTWATVPSGLFLPSVLDASQGTVATQGEHLVATGGVGLLWDVNRYVGLHLSSTVQWATPYRLEHLYEVRTSFDNLEVGAHFEVEGRYR